MSGGAILVKLNPGNISASWPVFKIPGRRIEPDGTDQVFLLDQNFQQLFNSYIRTQKIVGLFTIVAILIAVMGLFALTAFLTRAATKRNWNPQSCGASVRDITVLMSKSFLCLVFLATSLLFHWVGWLPLSGWIHLPTG